ncbi:glycosyltransferase family 39 protein [Lyngbya aestuarii]|uniref:glycosyltransferase family 39 protein n=1 Tax=Lyngbya aestuarii TaxID=118322 RepID=UPI00403D6938
MNNTNKLLPHYLALTGVIALGIALRFWHLDLKPLWLDEILTTLFSLGHNYNDLPLDVVFPLSTLEEIFTLKPEVSCQEIAHNLATQSTHPPLFFCLMHTWLTWRGIDHLVWQMRSLPALFGVGTIAAVYFLNRLAFSPTAGIFAAAFMAVSPFAVYLSQEARHYTLPMLLITLALLVLMPIIRAIYSQKSPKIIWWLLWGMINSVGCYIHYFFLIAFSAQILTITGLIYWRRQRLPKGSIIVALILVILGVAVSYLPWLPVLLGDFGRQETDWLPQPQHIAPLYQMLLGWLTMVITLPVEGQPLWIVVPMALLMIVFGSWVGWQGFRGIKQLWQQPQTQLATVTLCGFALVVILQFFAIVYLLGKDITIVPRYNFVYYPAMCALLGASFVFNRLKQRSAREQAATQINWQSLNLKPARFLFFVSFLSCIFVVNNLVFLKSFHPQQVAQEMNFEPNVPIMMLMGYSNFQDVALGLSFALAINQLHQGNSQGASDTSFTFLNKEQGYDLVWQKLSQLAASPAPSLNLWVVAPGLRQRDYPPRLLLGNQTRCTIDPTQHHRIGIPYQLYRCR